VSSPLRRRGEGSSYIVAEVLRSVEEIRIVPEVVAPQETPAPGEPQNLVGRGLGEPDEAREQVLG
jgi:hypothetical protein